MITGVPALAALAMGGMLTQLFNPLALGAGVIGGLAAVFRHYAAPFAKSKNKIIDRYTAADEIRLLDETVPDQAAALAVFHETEGLFDDPSRRLTPYLASPGLTLALVAGCTLDDLAIRALVDDNPEDQMEKLMDGVNRAREYFFATAENALLTTPQALSRFADKPEQLRFIYAHERAHRETGDPESISRKVLILGLAGFQPLLYATAALMALNGIWMSSAPTVPVPGFLMPFNGNGYVLGPLAALLGTAAAAPLVGLAITYADRKTEYRADRNGLYKTGDLDAAVGFMDGISAIESMSESPPTASGRLKALWDEHPSWAQRIARMRGIWPEIQQARRLAGIQAPERPAPRAP